MKKAISTTRVDLEIIILSGLSQTEKDKYHIAYLWNLKKNDPNEFTLQNRPTNTEDKLMVTKGVVRGKLGGWY